VRYTFAISRVLIVLLAASTARAQDAPLAVPTTQNALESTALRQPSGNTTPAQRTTLSAGGEILKLFFALGIVIVLILLLRWLLQRYLGVNVGGGKSGLVRVVSRTTLSPRQQVVLLQVGRRIVVVGDSAGTLTALAQITDDDEVANILGTATATPSDDAPPRRFGSLLSREQTRYDDETAAELPPAQPEHADIEAARSELSGLLDRVRQMKNDVQSEGDKR
jgi:flagellar biogenesis protein FliO